MHITYLEQALREIKPNTNAPLTSFRLVLCKHHEKILSELCFRHGPTAKAGKFRNWHSLKFMLSDKLIRQELLGEILEILAEIADNDFSMLHEERVVIEHTHPIGWSTTIPLSKLPPNTEIVAFKPNEWTDTFRVCNSTFLAPSTNLITFALSFLKNQQMGWVVCVETIYPGENVPLGYRDHPRVIAPEEAVFIEWNHDGEPINK